MKYKKMLEEIVKSGRKLSFKELKELHNKVSEEKNGIERTYLTENWEQIKKEYLGKCIAIRYSEILGADTDFNRLVDNLEEKKIYKFTVVSVGNTDKPHYSLADTLESLSPEDAEKVLQAIFPPGIRI